MVKAGLKKTFSFHYDGWKWSWNNNNCPVAQSFSYQRLLVYHQVAACCNLLHNLSLSWHSGWWRPIGDLLDQGRSACFEVSLTFSVWLGEDEHVAGNGTNAFTLGCDGPSPIQTVPKLEVSCCFPEQSSQRALFKENMQYCVLLSTGLCG